MARQDMPRNERWANENRRFRDDDMRDWRASGDDWRRGETYRSGRRDESSWADYGGSREAGDEGGMDPVRRRDIMGYGGANRDDREGWRGGDYGFGRSQSDRFGDAGRPGGTYGPGTYETGRGSSYYDRDVDWSYDRPGVRNYGSGDRWSGGGRGEERGFFERASDEVASWFGDRDAERRRNIDQFQGRGPKGYTRSDERIREDVSDRLTDDPFVDASEIEVMVTAAEVTLSGFVANRDQRRRAEDAAERASGVSHVQNSIRVRSTNEAGMGTTIGDKAFGRDTSTGDITGTRTTTGENAPSGRKTTR